MPESSRLATDSAVAFKIESHNHPIGRRAVSGRRDGRRRNSARRVHDGRASDRDAQLAAIRLARLTARSLPVRRRRRRASATTATASAFRPSAAKSSFDPVVRRRTRSSTRCASACSTKHELIRATRRGVGNPIIAVGARTGRDGIHGASFASEDLSARERRQASARAGRRSVHREAACSRRSLELITSGAHRRDSGHGRGRPHVVVGRDGCARRRRRHDRRHEGARPRRRHDAVRDSAQRVAGANARRRADADASRKSRRSSRNGTSRPR